MTDSSASADSVTPIYGILGHYSADKLPMLPCLALQHCLLDPPQSACNKHIENTGRIVTEKKYAIGYCARRTLVQDPN